MPTAPLPEDTPPPSITPPPPKNLALIALGVVFGDIGTSPLYAIQQSFAHGLKPDPANVLGIVSLIFWGLTLVVSLKYLFIVMRADNHGEGGILALLALTLGQSRRRGHRLQLVTLIGLAGTALFFSDSLITPAISVLSAVEGLSVASPAFNHAIVPLALSILVVLFSFQRAGTQKVGFCFGPIMVVWFGVLALLGVMSILQAPSILTAFNPAHAVRLLITHGKLAATILGAVLLAFTGAEALYADMGHFGPTPIRRAWFGLVMPALLLNYFGQGALLLVDPAAVSNPFYRMIPPAFLGGMIILASVATVIASQAVISGTFSLVRQAMHLDYLPRFTVHHTSEDAYGQIYMPRINLLLCCGVLLLVIVFRSSSALADAYGVAMTGTMVATTLLVFGVAHTKWEWPGRRIAAILLPLLFVDVILFATALSKVPEGGWLPVVIGGLLLTVLMTWRQGREVLSQHRRSRDTKLSVFLDTITETEPLRVRGTALYLYGAKDVVPQPLLNNLKHNKVLHERVLIVNVVGEEDPWVPNENRAIIQACDKSFWQVELHYGFMERPNVVADLETYLMADCPLDIRETSFFIGHDTFVEGRHPLRPRWREELFLWLSNHAVHAFEYFRIPSQRVVELGSQVEI